MDISPQRRVRVDSIFPCTIDKANGVCCSFCSEVARDAVKRAEGNKVCVWRHLQLAILLQHRESWRAA